MEKLFTKNAPAPGGHYTQGIRHGDFIFISGQLPIDPGSGEKIGDGIKEQTLQVLKNLEAIAVSGGSSKNNLIKINVFISDITYWPEVNKVYADFFGDHKPARAIVPTKDLHFGFKIEIDAVAVVI